MRDVLEPVMSQIADYAWCLGGRVLDLAPHQLDIVVDDIAKLPAATLRSTPGRAVKRAQLILARRAAAARRGVARRAAILNTIGHL